MSPWKKREKEKTEKKLIFKKQIDISKRQNSNERKQLKKMTI